MSTGEPPMAARKYKFIFVFLVSSCAVANDSDSINISNQLSSCITATNTAVTEDSEIPIFSFDLKMDKPISECGCKSALAAYTIYTISGDHKSYILGGKVGFIASSRKFLPLSAEKKLIHKKKLVIELSCAQPD
jgi:hypothetical protein